MTVKERLHKIVDEMSDEEAATTLERLASRRASMREPFFLCPRSRPRRFRCSPASQGQLSCPP
jgi:hypothetical protein